MVDMLKKYGGFAAVWLLCAVAAVIGLLWMACSFALGGGHRGWRIAIAFDQCGNAAAGGDEDEVFSSRCWRLRHRRPYTWIQPGIDRVFLWTRGETDHCRKAWEWERTRRQRTL